mgnify:CR=1 FL=1
MEKLQKEDFGIPDLAVEAGLKDPGKAFFFFEQTANGISVDFGASAPAARPFAEDDADLQGSVSFDIGVKYTF